MPRGVELSWTKELVEIFKRRSALMGISMSEYMKILIERNIQEIPPEEFIGNSKLFSGGA